MGRPAQPTVSLLPLGAGLPPGSIYSGLLPACLVERPICMEVSCNLGGEVQFGRMLESGRQGQMEKKMEMEHNRSVVHVEELELYRVWVIFFIIFYKLYNCF